jgi:hypothetical protein
MQPPIQGEWYQQSFWPLIGAALLLIIPNAVALWGIFIQTSRQTKSQLLMSQINFLSQQLAEFYDPIFTMLMVNGECFSRLGPDSFPRNPIKLETAGEVWNRVKEKLIIPNNQEIATILRTRSHLIARYDSIEPYLKLNEHISMYEIFVDFPNEIYENFIFPTDITSHIEGVRAKLVDELQNMKGGTYE